MVVLDQGGEKWPDSGYILKVGPKELADQLDVKCETKESEKHQNFSWPDRLQG